MPRLLLDENDRQAIEEFRKDVQRLLGDRLERLALFGSKAEGHGTSESDIDLMVLITDSAASMRDPILDLAFDVNLKYGVYISPRIITLSNYQHPIWKITPFMKRLSQQSIPI